MRIRSLVVAVALCALVLPVAACGSDDSSSDGTNGLADSNAVVAFQKGALATNAATDVVVKGTVPVEGKQSTVNSRYGGGKAQAVVKSKASSYQVIRSGQFLYVRGNLDFWTALVGRTQALKIGDKWARSLIEGPLGAFNYFVDLNSLLRASGKITKGEPTTVDGQPVLPLVDPKTNTDSTWWFRTTGEPVLQKYISGSTTKYTLDYDQVVIVEVPPNDQVIDITKIRVPTPAPTTP